MNETNISAADLARLVAMVKEHQSAVLSHRSACWDDSDERRDSTMRRMRDIERQIANAAPSLLAEVGRLRSLERHVRDVIRAAPTAADFDIGGRYDYDCDNIGDMEAKAAAREHQAIAGGLAAALSPSPEVGT